EAGWIRIANLGAQPLDVSSMTITNVSDDHEQMVVEVTIDKPGTSSLSPGLAEGDLVSSASSLIVPKMSEGIQEPPVSLLRVRIGTVSPSGTWLYFNATATLTIGNAYANIPLKITSSGTGSAS